MSDEMKDACKQTTLFPEPQKKPRSSALAHVLARWKREYEAAYGDPYIPAGADRKRLGEILREFPDRAAIEAFNWEALFMRYLADGDRWLRDNRHPLAWLCSNLNRYTGEKKRDVVAELNAHNRANYEALTKWGRQ